MHSVQNRNSADDSMADGRSEAANTRRTRRPRLTAGEQDEILRLYQNASVSAADIRERFGIGDSTLYRLLAQKGVSPRRRTGPRRRGQQPRDAATATRGRRSRSAPRTRSRTASVTSSVRVASRTPNGAMQAFRVSFLAVRVVEAESALIALRQVENQGATDVTEVRRQ
jgi:Helix-turn-helix domain of resolvase